MQANINNIVFNSNPTAIARCVFGPLALSEARRAQSNGSERHKTCNGKKVDVFQGSIKVATWKAALFALFFLSFCFENKAIEKPFILKRVFDCCMNKACSFCGMYFLNDLITKYITANKAARIYKNAEVDKLVREAWKDLEVPGKCPEVIKDDSQSPESFAYADYGGLFVTDLFDYSSYGIKRFSIYHEVAHLKYNDSLFQLFSYFARFALSAVVIHKITGSILPFKSFCSNCSILSFIRKSIIYSLSFLGGAKGCSMTDKYVWRYYERRADLSAARACKCFRCLEDMVKERACLDDPAENGYLTVEELLYFVDSYKEHNLLCEFHKTN